MVATFQPQTRAGSVHERSGAAAKMGLGGGRWGKGAGGSLDAGCSQLCSSDQRCPWGEGRRGFSGATSKKNLLFPENDAPRP